MFCHFWQKFENSKCGNEEIFFENCQEYIAQIPCGSKIDEIPLSYTVKEIEAILCFAIFGKNSKIQKGRHFRGGENFLKIAKGAFLR